MKKLLVTFIVFTSMAYGLVDMDELNANHCAHTINQAHTIVTPPLFFEDSSLQLKTTNSKTHYEFRYNSQSHELKGNTGKIRDFVVTQNYIWTVGTAGLIKHDLNGDFLSFYGHKSWQGSRHNLPRGVYYHKSNNHLYIASGGAGLLTFDLNTQQFTSKDILNVQNDNGHLSAAVAVVGDASDRLYIAMTGNSERGFNGVLSYSLNQKKILNKAEYNKRRAGVVFPYASIYLENNKVILNNGGWIHSLKLDQVESKSTVKPRWHAIAYYLNDVRKFVMMAGDLLFEEAEVIGCGRYFQNNGQVDYKAFKARIL